MVYGNIIRSMEQHRSDFLSSKYFLRISVFCIHYIKEPGSLEEPQNRSRLNTASHLGHLAFSYRVTISCCPYLTLALQFLGVPTIEAPPGNVSLHVRSIPAPLGRMRAAQDLNVLEPNSRKDAGNRGKKQFI